MKTTTWLIGLGAAVAAGPAVSTAVRAAGPARANTVTIKPSRLLMRMPEGSPETGGIPAWKPLLGLDVGGLEAVVAIEVDDATEVVERDEQLGPVPQGALLVEGLVSG